MPTEAPWQLVGTVGLGLFVLMVVGFSASLWHRHHTLTLGHMEAIPTPPVHRGLLTRLVTSGPPGEWPLPRLWLLRIFILINVAFAFNYIGYRYLFSINWAHWPFALILLAAETYSLLGTVLFSIESWLLRRRDTSPVEPGLTVDVFITRYNEPVELLQETIRAAVNISYPHTTYVLDDGDSLQLKEYAEQGGAIHVTRTADWQGHERYAKAGNVNNALMHSSGEFILILDADQMALPQILDRTLGYFRDPNVAFVQTPQWFYNVREGDPLGSQANLFYGPIQQSKDNWGAAFFCGSNGILRREALLQLGVRQYVKDLRNRMVRAFAASKQLVDAALAALGKQPDPKLAGALAELRIALNQARARLRSGDSLQEITWEIQREVERISGPLVDQDLAGIEAELRELSALSETSSETSSESPTPINLRDQALVRRQLASREWTPLGSLGMIRQLLLSLDLDVWNQAQPIMPMATNSVTEDLATAMRLHALGWKSVFHREILAVGLAPEDLGTLMAQRLRWAQGTIQVLFLQNPLTLRGLGLGQRVAYLSTIWSYFYGFAAVVYLAAPMLYLFLGVTPITDYSGAFFLRFAPYFVVNQVVFALYAWGLPRYRAQQINMALFPIWIDAVVSAVKNIYFHQPLSFVVTPKNRVKSASFRFVTVQVVLIFLLIVAVIYGLLGLALGLRPDGVAVLANVFWATYGLLLLSVVVRALLFVNSADTSVEELNRLGLPTPQGV